VTLAGLRGIGVDYGTGGVRAAVLGGGAPRVAVFEGPHADGRAADWLCALDGELAALPCVLPSGFGVPLRALADLDAASLAEVTLRRTAPEAAGLGAFLARLARGGARGHLIPAVKQLPTVPPHRKVNRVDMGTSDKLCAAALAVWALAGGDPGGLGRVDCVLLDVGAGFKAWVVAAGGRVVDGIGGTAGTPGPLARGALDGELAYLQPPSRKADIYGGGAADLDAAFPGGLGERALWEGIAREAAMLTRFYGIDRIVVTGRRAGEAAARLVAAGYDAGSAPPLADGLPAGSEAALGAAVLADGLAGGRAAPLAGHLRLGEATDRVLSYVWTAS